MANSLINTKNTRRTVMLFMLIMAAIIILVLFKSGSIGAATANRIDFIASGFQAFVALITVLALFIMLSIAVYPPKDIDAAIRNDKVANRTEARYLDKFVIKARKEGYSDDQIKEGLVRFNWGEDLIDSCLAKQEA